MELLEFKHEMIRQGTGNSSGCWENTRQILLFGKSWEGPSVPSRDASGSSQRMGKQGMLWRSDQCASDGHGPASSIYTRLRREQTFPCWNIALSVPGKAVRHT